ncbi:hypothetical protein VW29_16260 [Devosia limi DSM 17137]|uniref:O-antigen ligase like membrane protein n=1 Tax=Devosia limi DSM 17137 TaxID=1121477 RepID=A0A0F5LIY0_9HYPH|nr:hypothetical protein [Devosia limi]KKB82371.1 hypothetical protein VW29_16260 [Devosia limi DSM 17137]SHE64062.1 hypothetical protein SAMN02745223_00759 [Devosia limi DSM 17137]
MALMDATTLASGHARRSQCSLAAQLSRRFFIALLFVMPSGLPLSLFGVPAYQSDQIQIVIIAPLVGVRALQLLQRRWLDRWESTIMVFLLYCYFVSFISNSFFIPQPPDGWLPGLVLLVPLLLLFALDAFKITVKEVIDGLLIAALFAAMLVNVDRVSPIAGLDSYLHTAIHDPSLRRIVVMHNEMGFAFVILVARLLNMRTLGGALLYLAALALLSGPLFVVSETRLVIAAAVIGCMLYALLVYRSTVKALVLSVLAVIAAGLSPLIFGKYIDYAMAMGDLGDDPSVRFRAIEILHFGQLFDQTAGFGFGLMSLSPNKPNILTDALFRDAALYGAPDYWLSLVDIRIYGALYQFGYVGFVLVLGLTLIVAYRLWWCSREVAYTRRDDVGAVAATVVAFMLSPLPMNLFTAENTVTIGGMLWFLTARASREVRALRQAPP